MHLHQPLAHSALESFEKLTLKKKPKRLSLNGHISKTRTNSESKLRFSSSSFNVLENCVVFSTHVSTRQGALSSTNTDVATSGRQVSKG